MSKVQNIENKILIILVILAAIVMIALGYIWTLKPNDNEIKTEEIGKIESKEDNNTNITTDTENDKSANTESASSSIGNTVDDISLEANNNTKNTTNTNTNNSSNTENTMQSNNENIANSVDEQSTSATAEEEPSFIMPVNGEIIKGFAKDNLVFSETLQEWVVHQAIDLKAEARDVVKASADGKVKAIKNDPRYGLTVIIEHSAGFETVYSNLLTAEYVVEGEEVKQGQTIGTVGTSAVFEISDESHLHFEMLKNSEYVDPNLYMK